VAQSALDSTLSGPGEKQLMNFSLQPSKPFEDSLALSPKNRRQD
jgi:hypothetical protein